jgi:hypothetical protein
MLYDLIELLTLFGIESQYFKKLTELVKLNETIEYINMTYCKLSLRRVRERKRLVDLEQSLYSLFHNV